MVWRTWSFCHHHQRLGSSSGSGSSETSLSQKQKPIYTCLPICHVWAPQALVWSSYISGFCLAKQKVSAHIQKWISECCHRAFVHTEHIGEVMQRRPWGVFMSLYVVCTRLCPLASSDTTFAGTNMLLLQQRFEAYWAEKVKEAQFPCGEANHPEEPWEGQFFNDCHSQKQHSTDSFTLTRIKQMQFVRHQSLQPWDVKCR